MGAAGKAFTFVGRDQGDELTRVENLINMVIPAATLEGFEARPTPTDWTPSGPGETMPPAPDAPRAPILSRFERPWGAGATAAAASTPEGATPIALPPRTIGSKIPINRRHRRRR
jgi:hypothetical protein